MSIRNYEPSQLKNLTLTLYLSDGNVVGPCDTSSSDDNVVSVWVNDVLTLYPMDKIAKIELNV